MTNSLLVEIDEATKDIMFDLQEGLTKNIADGISSSLDYVITEQSRNTEELQRLLTSQLDAVSSEITASKKPIHRMARDVEDTVSLTMRIEKQSKEQITQLGIQQKDQLVTFVEQIKADNENVLEKINHTGHLLTTKLAAVEQSHKENMKELLGKMEESLQRYFDQLETKLHNSDENVVHKFNKIEQTSTINNANLEEVLHSQNKVIKSLHETIKDVEAKVSDESGQQSLLKKLADVEEDLAYQRLPFYKKWFIKREDFSAQNNT